MHFSTLLEWLNWINTIHNTEIDLGLERIKKVAFRLKISQITIPVIIVGGTNGKGSTVAGLEAIYRESGYQVGSFTSPVLFKHNEQVRINGRWAHDKEFCIAFEKIEAARQEISLTSFEFFTLAALYIFAHHSLDVLLLEVGLGGRLDAVNIINADVSVITSIGIDHQEYLGHTREKIALEKAGIFRRAKPAVVGDCYPPITLFEYAKNLGTPLVSQNQDFTYQENKKKGTWSWKFKDVYYENLPVNSLATQNMSTVLMVITLLQNRLKVTREAIQNGLQAVHLPGRIQLVKSAVNEIYDVSHNPDSVSLLAKKLDELHIEGKVHAVFSMLADKDIAKSIEIIRKKIDDWHVATLATQRTATVEMLKNIFAQEKISSYHVYPTIRFAYEEAKKKAQPNDWLVIFGSFHTVAEVANSVFSPLQMKISSL